MRIILCALLVSCAPQLSIDQTLCRWQPIGSWTASEDGAAWVTGDAGLAYWDEDYCPSHRCLDVPAGDTVIFLGDPFSDGGDIYTEIGRHCNEATERGQ